MKVSDPSKVSRAVVQSLKDGDHKAFEIVFFEYFNKIKLYIWKIIKSEDDAEELAQSIFVKLWENRETLNIHTAFGGFIYMTARNSALNFIKSKNIRQSYKDAKMRVGSELMEAPDSNIYVEELRLIIEMHIQKMPKRRQEIYILCKEEGLTHDEIASKLGISKKTVENQLSLALKELKEVILLAIILLAVA